MAPTISRTTLTPSARVESAYRGPCRILGAPVTRVTHGGTTRIICEEYCETEGICRLRQAALELGTTQGLIDARSEGVALAGIRCVMLTA